MGQWCTRCFQSSEAAWEKVPGVEAEEHDEETCAVQLELEDQQESQKPTVEGHLRVAEARQQLQELAALSPPPEEAQKMPLVIRRGAFTSQEVIAINEVAQAVKKRTAKQRKRQMLRHGWIVGQKVIE